MRFGFHTQSDVSIDSIKAAVEATVGEQLLRNSRDLANQLSNIGSFGHINRSNLNEYAVAYSDNLQTAARTLTDSYAYCLKRLGITRPRRVLERQIRQHIGELSEAIVVAYKAAVLRFEHENQLELKRDVIEHGERMFRRSVAGRTEFVLNEEQLRKPTTATSSSALDATEVAPSGQSDHRKAIRVVTTTLLAVTVAVGSYWIQKTRVDRQEEGRRARIAERAELVKMMAPILDSCNTGLYHSEGLLRLLSVMKNPITGMRDTATADSTADRFMKDYCSQGALFSTVVLLRLEKSFDEEWVGLYKRYVTGVSRVEFMLPEQRPRLSDVTSVRVNMSAYWFLHSVGDTLLVRMMRYQEP
jgi:hypothetical protein